MFQRFTDRARKVMALANQQAQRWNHEFISTEHILFGLIKEGSGTGVTVLKHLGVDINELRSEVEKLVKRGPDRVMMGKLPQAPGAKKVIEYAIEECRSLNQDSVGTEHILLGLLREDEGMAAQVLVTFGLQIELVRREVLMLLNRMKALRERESRACEDKGENKLLIRREGSGVMDKYERFYGRFTDRARKVFALANQEAQRLNHEYIGTEHILLGLVKEGSGIGATVLKNLGVDIKTLRLEVERLVKRGPDRVTMGKLPQTPRAKKVIEYAIDEARNLNHDYLGTEHILLGLLRESEGIAAQVLMNLGLKIEQVKSEVFLMLSGGKKKPLTKRAPRTQEDKEKEKLLLERKGNISMNQDEQYLKLLSVFHYVVGGLAACFACIPIIHLAIGIAMLVGAIDDAPAIAGVLLVMIGMIGILMGWTLAVCIIIAGRCLAKRRRYMFCLVMGAISCIFMPFGTVLGVFTIIVLMRPSVKELFAVNKTL